MKKIIIIDNNKIITQIWKKEQYTILKIYKIHFT